MSLHITHYLLVTVALTDQGRKWCFLDAGAVNECFALLIVCPATSVIKQLRRREGDTALLDTQFRTVAGPFSLQSSQPVSTCSCRRMCATCHKNGTSANYVMRMSAECVMWGFLPWDAWPQIVLQNFLGQCQCQHTCESVIVIVIVLSEYCKGGRSLSLSHWQSIISLWPNNVVILNAHSWRCDMGDQSD